MLLGTSLLSPKNEHQPSVKDHWLCSMVIQSVMRVLLCIYRVLTGFIGQNANENLVALLKTNKVVIVLAAVTTICLAFLPLQAANFVYIDICDPAPHRLTTMHDQKSLMLR